MEALSNKETSFKDFVIFSLIDEIVALPTTL
jgi:hypothetical protein